MAATLTRKAWRELTRRKARSLFTVATIAAAVAGLWLFAVPSLIDDAMNERVKSDLLWDLRLSPDGVVLSDADIAAIRDLPNVAAIEARVLTNTTVWFSGVQTPVLLVGVDDFTDQEVNVVQLLDGTPPGEGQVLVDPQNARSGRLGAGIGDDLSLGGSPVVVSGVGTTLEWSATVDDSDPVLYIELHRLQNAIDYPGISWIDLRVDDRSPQAMAAAGDAVQEYLSGVDPDIGYWTTLRSRAPGDWPEKDDVGNVVQLMYIIAVLGLVSALLMVYTTMNTVVREQTREIGIIKAVGGPRRAIVRSYLLTAAILGGLGTAIGVAAGIPLANLLVGFAGRQFSGIEPGFGIPPFVLLLSIVVGLGATMAAAAPAILRATRVPVRHALVDHGVTESFGAGTVDAALRRTRLLSRPARLGLRNAARRKARTLTTALQIGFAVGTFLGFLAMGIAIMDLSDRTYDGEGGDIEVQLNADADAVIAGVPGVAAMTPVVYADAGVAGESYALQGQTPDAAPFHPDLLEGRWFDEDEESEAQLVAVVGPALAEIAGIRVGDSIGVETALREVDVTVVGIDSLMVNDGKTLFLPLSTTLSLTDRTVPHAYYITTTQSDKAFVDATTAAVQRALATARIPATVEARYIDRQANQSQNRLIIAILMILGFPVIAIGMIGLVNTMTMNVFERTREIGILRSIGARKRHIRRMIRAEALAVSALGWLAAIPLGYLIATVLIKLLSNSFDVTFAVLYPLWPLPLALVATLLIAMLVVMLPVRRAVGLRPGVALRYE